MVDRKLPPDKKLIELYENGLSCGDIGDMYGYSLSYISTHIRRLGVSRTTAETLTFPGRHKPLQTKEWFYQKYWVEELSMVDIGKILDRDPKTIFHWFRKYGIETRPRGHNRDENLQNGREPGFIVSEETREIVRQQKLKSGHVPYLRNGKHWLVDADPEDNPNWKGGVTPERTSIYNSREWKNAIKEVWKRDNAICQRCGLDARDVPSKERRFHTHHIASFADFPDLRTDVNNLVLLCDCCHRWVHSNENTRGEFIYVLAIV